jgi:hypothetical protein
MQTIPTSLSIPRSRTIILSSLLSAALWCGSSALVWAQAQAVPAPAPAPAPAVAEEEGEIAVAEGEETPIIPAAPDGTVADAPPVEAPASEPVARVEGAKWIATLGGPTVLTFNFREAKAPEVAAEISRQSGLRIEASPQWAGEERAITAQADKLPFWDAVSLLREQAKVDFVSDPLGDWQLVPYVMSTAPAKGVLSVDWSGSSLSVERVERLRALSPNAPEASRREDRLMIMLASRLDPKWKPQPMSLSWANLQVLDAKGRATRATMDPGNMGMASETSPLAFDAAGIDGGGPVTLSGELRFLVPTKTEKWEITNLAQAQKQQKSVEVDGEKVLFSFDGVTQTSEGWQIKLSAAVDPTAPQRHIEREGNSAPGEAAATYPIPISPFGVAGAGGIARLYNAQNAPVAFTDAGTQQNEGRTDAVLQTLSSVNAEGQPSVGEAPARLEVDLPLEWREVRLPFEIKNIPLP